jgi:predicted RNA binding protein YcfA (HicA-like mRNA interferase family)
MPRLPLVSGAQAVRALERLGFSQVRQRGSHVILKRVGPDKQAGITSEEFVSNL